jgi:Ca-activated chloride channel family protein
MNLETLAYFHFLRPAFLWLLLPFVLVIYYNWYKAKKQQQGLHTIPKHLREILTVGEKKWRNNLPLKLLFVACLVGIVIIAGPSWTKQPSPFGEDKADLVLVLDASSSMNETDVAPNRLDLAKFKLMDLVAQRGGGRTALVIYSGSAHVAMPLTKDTKVFESLLQSVSSKMMPREGKFAEYSLPVIDKLTSQSSFGTSVLLVTDGLSQKASDDFSKYFAQSSNQLLIWGIGDTSKQAPIAFEESQLKSVASQSGGDFITVTTDNKDVKRVLNKIETHLQMSDESVMPWKDSGYPLVFVLALIYLMWFRKGWMVKWCLLGAVSMSGLAPNNAMASEWQFIDLWMTKDQQGQRLYQNDEFFKAAQTFESSEWKAISYYRSSHYDLAQQYFGRIDSLSAQFGVATALAHQREYVAARKAFQLIVDREPDFPGAQQNLDLMQSIIDQIDQFSESQSNTLERQNSRELDDQPQTSEGAETQVTQEQLIAETLSSEEILNDPEMNKLWMQRVESNLATFLASKFYYQLQEGTATAELTNEQ